jgi:hypothetical protein
LERRSCLENREKRKGFNEKENRNREKKRLKRKEKESGVGKVVGFF